MVDISLCSNKTCKLRETCYRAQATPDPHWQSYSEIEPREAEVMKEGSRVLTWVTECDYYIHVESKSQMKGLNIMTKGKKR